MAASRGWEVEEVEEVEKVANEFLAQRKFEESQQENSPGFLSRLGGFFAGFMMGVLLTPLSLLDVFSAITKCWIKYEIYCFYCHQYGISTFDIVDKLEYKEDGKVGHMYFDAVDACCAEKDKRGFFSSIVRYTLTRPFSWLVRPFFILVHVVVNYDKLTLLPFYYGFVGAKAGLLGSFVDVPADWYKDSHVVSNVKKAGNGIINFVANLFTEKEETSSVDSISGRHHVVGSTPEPTAGKFTLSSANEGFIRSTHSAPGSRTRSRTRSRTNSLSSEGSDSELEEWDSESFNDGVESGTPIPPRGREPSVRIGSYRNG